ncbi:MAG TPA: tetratricopeptide repeat protein [Silvibacterium sp.]|nr:tetratricopeptide repeat protein [Silvibacterium sp.]
MGAEEVVVRFGRRAVAAHLPAQVYLPVMPEDLPERSILERLEVALVERNIQEGFSLLDACTRVSPENPEGISLLLCLAQWVDLGYRDLGFLEEHHARFAQTEIANLRFLDALKWKLANAFRSLATEDLEECIASLDLILRAGEGVLSPHLRFVAHFWKGRAHRKKGEYEAALLHIAAARETAEEAGASRLVASTKIHEGWLVFQRGERRRAAQLMDEAEAELNSTGHALSLGNIESARGRLVRRTGDYAKALAHFEHAIAIYSSAFPDHPNCARALVNAAYVKGLIAHEMQSKIGKGPAKGTAHSRYLAVFREALELLSRAGEIYALSHHQTGLGSVLVNSGHLHLESGDIEKAAAEADKAFTLGEEKRDQILMARARILEAAIELALADEEIAEHPDASFHAARALEHAEEAIELACHTQNKRLLAEAYLMRGAAAADERFQDWETAKIYANKANDLLSKEDRDHLLKELGALKTKIYRATGIDQTLREWSDGQLGNKTFQQIQEEFAEIVIPKVWLNHGKNITRVAQQLAISPKKVRRILRNVQTRDS